MNACGGGSMLAIRAKVAHQPKVPRARFDAMMLSLSHDSLQPAARPGTAARSPDQPPGEQPFLRVLRFLDPLYWPTRGTATPSTRARERETAPLCRTKLMR